MCRCGGVKEKCTRKKENRVLTEPLKLSGCEWPVFKQEPPKTVVSKSNKTEREYKTTSIGEDYNSKYHFLKNGVLYFLDASLSKQWAATDKHTAGRTHRSLCMYTSI